MDMHKITNTFLQLWKRKRSFNEGNDPPEIYRERLSINRARIQDIERAKTAELIKQAETLCASQKAHSNAVLKRLGLQRDTLPSCQSSSSLTRQHPEFSVQQGRIRSDFNECPINIKNNNWGWTSVKTQTWDEQNTHFERTLHQESQAADKLYATDRNPSPDSNSLDSLSTVDRETPSELRAISHLKSPVPSPFTPTPTQTTTRRKSCLPIKMSGAGRFADVSTVQSGKDKVDDYVKRFEQFQLNHHPSPQHPATPKRTTVVPKPPTSAAPTNSSQSRPSLAAPKKTTMVPKPSTAAAPPNRRQLRQLPTAPKKTANFPKPPIKATLSNRKGPKCMTTLEKEDLKPLINPSQSLSLCFKQLQSEDWEKKVDGLKSIRALARHHPEILQTKLHEVCIVVTEEVNNLRSNVACAAIDTIAELHVDLGKAMDPEAERTGSALLLKLAQTTSIFIHRQTNRALDVLVHGCSPGRVISALLNTGLSHACAAVRGSTAEHLHQLADIIGEDRIMKAGKTFTERFIVAVSKMAVDAALEVRQHGQKMLEELAPQKEFIVLWDKLVPRKDQGPLAKILKKMRQ